MARSLTASVETSFSRRDQNFKVLKQGASSLGKYERSISHRSLSEIDGFTVKAIALGITLIFLLEFYYIITVPDTTLFFIFVDIF